MKTNNKFLTVILALLVIASQTTFAATNIEPPEASFTAIKPWSFLLYAGGTAKQDLKRVAVFDISSAHEMLYSAEIAYSIAKDNPIQKYLYWLTDTIQLANNFAVRQSLQSNTQAIYEDDIYFDFRWTKVPFTSKEFPWHNTIATTFAGAYGTSYATAVPYSERNPDETSSKRWLNFLMFEITVAKPEYPNVQLVARVHHRSSAFGLYYHDHNAGSNAIGLGIRLYF